MSEQQRKLRCGSLQVMLLRGIAPEVLPQTPVETHVLAFESPHVFSFAFMSLQFLAAASGVLKNAARVVPNSGTLCHIHFTSLTAPCNRSDRLDLQPPCQHISRGPEQVELG